VVIVLGPLVAPKVIATDALAFIVSAEDNVKFPKMFIGFVARIVPLNPEKSTSLKFAPVVPGPTFKLYVPPFDATKLNL
jgi:Ca2+/H+ antiporter